MKFGTDGVRGRVGVDLTADDARRLGRVVGRIVADGGDVVVGGDTRVSTPMLEAALIEGLVESGCRVIRLGVAPTPMVAFHASRSDAVGVVVSASHNPYYDNGLKVFGVGGRKLSAAIEAEIEAELEAELEAGVGRSLTGPGTTDDVPGVSRGVVVDDPRASGEYLDHLLTVLDGRRLEGMRIVVDAANGAASDHVVDLFAAAGADVHAINHRPDGVNINVACGATDPRVLGRAVVEAGADVGLALDGDADRVIAVDEHGEVIDGDHIIALMARDLRDRGALADDTVVVTVMTNLGFHRAMRAAGIAVVETPVGDRAVLEALETRRLSLGGEQSGHIIWRDRATTGDGMLSGLILLDLLCRQGRPLSVIAGEAMTRLPQLLVNIELPVLDGEGRRRLEQMIEEVAAGFGSRIGEDARLLIRPSGTEPLLRVMVEAASDEAARRLADSVVGELSGRLAALSGRGTDR